MVRTGQTIYEQIVSVDANCNPITAATFTVHVFKDGNLYSGVTPSVSLVQEELGIFSTSWSADTTGDYQVYLKNDLTKVIYVSEIYKVRPDSDFDQTIFIGL